VVAVVWLWGPTYALRQWWGIVILGLLLAAGYLALRRETLKEFPGATAADRPPPAPAPTTPV